MRERDKMSRPTKKISPYIDLLEPEAYTSGQKPYDSQQIYMYLFDNVDRNMVLLYSQKELAEAIGIARESLNYFIRDAIDLGWIEKESKSFKLVKRPDEIEWTKELYAKLGMLRRWHQPYFRKKFEEQGLTKGDILND
jgi:hypothetical protein